MLCRVDWVTDVSEKRSSSILGSLDPEGSSTLFLNIGNYLPIKKGDNKSL